MFNFFSQNLTLTPYPVGYDPKKKRKPPDRQPPPVEDEVEENPSPGTFSMAKLMARMKVVSSVSKDYTIAEWKKFCNDNSQILTYVVLSCKNAEGEFERVFDIVTAVPQIRMIQVAFHQGSFQSYKDIIERLRRALPEKSIMASVEFSKVNEKKMYSRITQQNNPVVQVAIPGNVVETEVDMQTGKKSLIFEFLSFLPISHTNFVS